jgi:hypothetical protein
MIRFERTRSGMLEAVADVAVGIGAVSLRTPLGPWVTTTPDPTALAGAPVLLLPDPTWTETARTGALRAGRQPPILILPADVPAIGGQLLVAVAERVEVVLVPGRGLAAAHAARVLNGRPILALPADDPVACEDILRDLEVDVHVPVPSLEGTARDELRELMRGLEPERMHHVVEVDPRPAFDDPERLREASLGGLVSAAAGVLAGRLAVAARRWRSVLA